MCGCSASALFDFSGQFDVAVRDADKVDCVLGETPGNVETLFYDY